MTPDDPLAKLVGWLLSSTRSAFVTVGPTGEVLEASPRAQELLSSPAGGATSIGSLVGIDRDALDHLDEFGRALIGTTPRNQAVKVRAVRLDGGRLLVSAAPVEIDEAGPDQPAEINKYIGLISHDIVAPARRLGSFASLLRGAIEEGADADDALELLASIERGISHLVHLTSDLLRFARFGDEGFVMSEVDPGEVLATVREQLGDLLDETRSTVSTGFLVPVVGSASVLEMVFSNLIQNAIRYARPGVDPVVQVAAERDADRVRIDVADNGIGIRADQWTEVFEPFRRLHPTDPVHTGLGLAIVRRMVETMHGSIAITASEPGAGTTFSIWLPAAG